MSIIKEKWDDLKTRRFVLSYLDKPSLWNTKHKGYNQKIEVV